MFHKYGMQLFSPPENRQKKRLARKQNG